MGLQACSNCNTAILFMTDGDSDWNDDNKAWLRQEREARGCLAVFTYALGSGADSAARHHGTNATRHATRVCRAGAPDHRHVGDHVVRPLHGQRRCAGGDAALLLTRHPVLG